MRYRGSIARLSDRGFGFIRMDDGSTIFFHASSLVNRQFQNLAAGWPVEFDFSANDSRGPRAERVEVIID